MSTTTCPSVNKNELNGGQVANGRPLNQTPAEPRLKHPKSFRSFSFRKKNTTNLDNRQAEKPLRRLSFKSVALAIQKLLIRVSLPSKPTTDRVESGLLQSGTEPSSSPSNNPSNEIINRDTVVHSNGVVTPPKPNWNSVFSGIRNHGNTCFLNAIIQCLSHTDLLAKYFVLDSYKEDLERLRKPHGHGEVTERLAVLIKSLWTSRYSAELSSGFKSIVGKHGAQYKGTLQHDAQEFLLWLLDAVHEDINRSAKKKSKVNKNPVLLSDKSVDSSTVQTYLANNQSFILDIFQALLRSSLTCPRCGKQSITFDPYLSLSLSIPQRTTCPVRLTYIRSLTPKRHSRIAVSIAVKSSILDLLDRVASLMNVDRETLVLTEIYSDGFRRTFRNTQLVSVVQNSHNLYVFELSGCYNQNCVEKPTLLMQSMFPRLPTVSLLVVNCEIQENKRLKRFGVPFSLRVLKELDYLSLQEEILKAMSNTKSSKVNGEVFALRVCVDGRSGNGSYLSLEIDHPLYQNIVEESLKCCDVKTGPPHVRLIAEWSKESRERYVNFDPNEKLYNIHRSVEEVESLHEEPWIVTIDECLRLYTQEEELSADDAWLCPNCKQLQQGAKKQLHLHTTADLLIIHLKRFKQLKTGRTKLHLMVDFPVEGLDMSPYMAKDKHLSNEIPGVVRSRPGHHIYDLYAVCNHLGSMSAGHYIAVCKNPVDGLWYSYDDFRVAQIPQQDIVSNSAYLLFYVRRSEGHPTTSRFAGSPVSPDHWVFKLPDVSLKSSHESLQHSESNSQNEEKENENEPPNLAEYYVSRKFQSDTYFTSRPEQSSYHVISESCV